jgi:hypothetical protein
MTGYAGPGDSCLRLRVLFYGSGTPTGVQSETPLIEISLAAEPAGWSVAGPVSCACRNSRGVSKMIGRWPAHQRATRRTCPWAARAETQDAAPARRTHAALHSAIRLGCERHACGVFHSEQPRYRARLEWASPTLARVDLGKWDGSLFTTGRFRSARSGSTDHSANDQAAAGEPGTHCNEKQTEGDIR